MPTFFDIVNSTHNPITLPNQMSIKSARRIQRFDCKESSSFVLDSKSDALILSILPFAGRIYYPFRFSFANKILILASTNSRTNRKSLLEDMIF